MNLKNDKTTEETKNDSDNKGERQQLGQSREY